MAKRVALYVRVSTAEQAQEGFSLGGQEARLRKEAERIGLPVFRVYRDEGVSGAVSEREALQELLADARNGCFSEVLVWSVSRFSRILLHFLGFLEELSKLGIRFRSLSEAFDPELPSGKFVLSALGSVAEMQRDSWMEASRIGMEQRVRTGRWHGGTVLGYQSVSDPADPKGGNKLELIPKEAALVRYIFEMYAVGLGYKAITNRLNAERKTSKNGKAFTISGVSLILKNPVYVGKVRQGEILAQGLHAPIIDEALWESVQTKSKAHSKQPKKVICKGSWLSGLIRCPECGGPMVPQHTNRKRKDGSIRVHSYYACNANLNQGKAVCHANSVPAIAAEAKVEKWLIEYLANPFWVKKVSETIKKRQEAESAPVLAERALAEAKIIELEKEQEKNLDRYEIGRISKEELAQSIQRVRCDREAVESRLEEVRVRCSRLPGQIEAKDVKAAFASFRQLFSKAGTDKKKELARSLIETVQVNSSREVVAMELRVPTLALQGSGQEKIVVELL